MKFLTAHAFIAFILITAPLFGQASDNMAVIGGGTYLPFYGSDDEPVHIEPFYLDKYHVTNQDFLEFVIENPQWRKSQIVPVFADEMYLRHWAGDLDLGQQADQIRNSPVTNISWFAARAYAQWKEKRLPTLEEWEYAAAASEFEPEAHRDSTFVSRVLGWYSQPQPTILAAVNSGTPNYYGIHNMHGQVWEWVQDFNTVFITGESRDSGSANRQFFCAAGAATATDMENYAAFIRFAFRGSLEASHTVNNLGFRLAKDINH